MSIFDTDVLSTYFPILRYCLALPIFRRDYSLSISVSTAGWKRASLPDFSHVVSGRGSVGTGRLAGIPCLYGTVHGGDQPEPENAGSGAPIRGSVAE